MNAIMADEHRFSDAAGLHRGPMPLEPYRSKTFFEGVRENIFGRAWLLIGREEEVAEPGDFVVKDVEIRDVSVIVVRGKDGQIRAFHNACPHRGNQVVWEKSGNVPAFVCRYHSWTYATDGTLRGVPDQAMFVGLGKSNCGLSPITLQMWEGWIFINLARDPEVTLIEFLGPFADYYKDVPYPYLSDPIVMVTELACNWKVLMDAFAEAYHIPTLHPKTLRSMFSNKDNAFGRLLDFKVLGTHAVNSMFGNSEYLPTPSQPVEMMTYDPAHIAADHVRRVTDFLAHRAVNPTDTPNWSMDVNYVFPNTHIDANPSGLFVHQFWPIDLNKTRHEVRFYLRPPQTIRERFAQEFSVAHAMDIVLEDVSNVERTQRGINSGGTETIQLSESEVLIRYSLNQIMRWVEAASARHALSGGDTVQ